MDSQVDEIKNRLDIADIVSEYIKLNQVGGNFRALCPFHSEKSPSFMVSRDKQIWHCFGCGEGGDVFSFVMKIEGVEFPEALRILANKAGVQLQKQDPALFNQKTKLLDLLSLATKFYHKILVESPKAQKPLNYLLGRGLSKETIEEFQIGYAPESWDVTKRFLEQKGYRENDIFLAGLLSKKEGGRGLYDRFRDRIMFPIRDVHSNIVGFTGRAMKDTSDVGGKYVNTPQSIVFDKGRLVFNLDKAKNEIRQKGFAIVVEGQMDVISVYQAGIKNVVASSGTALTQDQVRLLKRYSPSLYLCFDMDQAGQTAAKKGIGLALSMEMNLKIIVIPEGKGKDPDECVKNYPLVWADAVENALPLIDYFIQKAKKDYNLKDATQKAKAINGVLEILAKINDPVEQISWLQKISNQLEAPEDILRERLKVYKKKNPNKPINTDLKMGIIDKKLILSERVLALILKYGPGLPYVIENLSTEAIKTEDLRELYKELVSYYTIERKPEINIDDFLRKLDKNHKLKTLAETLMLMAEKEFLDFEEKDLQSEARITVLLLMQDYLSDHLKNLEQDIKQAEKNNNKEQADKLLKEFGKLSMQLKNL